MLLIFKKMASRSKQFRNQLNEEASLLEYLAQKELALFLNPGWNT